MSDERLTALMAEQLRAPYPAECRGQAIDGVELVLLDADIYGVATRYERSQHQLTLSDRKMLSSLLADLDRIWPSLPTEQARSYYGTARELGTYLLQSRSPVPEDGIDE